MPHSPPSAPGENYEGPVSSAVLGRLPRPRPEPSYNRVPNLHRDPNRDRARNDWRIQREPWLRDRERPDNRDRRNRAADRADRADDRIPPEVSALVV